MLSSDMRLAYVGQGELMVAVNTVDAAAAERIMSEHVSLRAEQVRAGQAAT